MCGVARVELTVGPEVNFYLQNRKRVQIAELERRSGKPVIIRSDLQIASDEIRLALFDARDGMVYLEELGMTPAEPLPARHVGHAGRTDTGRGDNRRRGGRNQRDRGHGPYPPPSSRPRELPERDEEEDVTREIEDVEEDVDRREQAEEEGEEVIDSPAEAVSGEEAPAAQQDESSPPRRDYRDDNGGQGGRGPRRRGRRGGRGRNRGGFDRGTQPQEQSVGESVGELEIDTEIRGEIEEAEPEENGGNAAESEPNGNVLEEDTQADLGNELNSDERPQRRRRRGRRGGRGRRRGGAENAPQNMNQREEPSGPRPMRDRVPPPSLPAPSPRQDDAPRAAEATTLTRTGSADKHLVQDEPVAPQPLPRPRTYRDLDTIPDDFD